MAAPTLYHVDRFGAFNGETSPARLSPADAALGETVWLIPDGATTEAPPEVQASEVAVLERSQWTVTEDHRGQAAYDTTTRAARIVEAPGPIGEGETLQAPPTPRHTWNGKAWELLPASEPVPAEVTPAQLRLALDAADMLDAVEALVDQLGKAARIRWDYGVTIPRNDALVSAAAQAAGWSDAQVDELFRSAALL